MNNIYIIPHYKKLSIKNINLFLLLLKIFIQFYQVLHVKYVSIIAIFFISHYIVINITTLILIIYMHYISHSPYFLYTYNVIYNIYITYPSVFFSNTS